jgi:hypothetical protein
VLARVTALERHVSAQGQTIERLFSLLDRHFGVPRLENAGLAGKLGSTADGSKDEP